MIAPLTEIKTRITDELAKSDTFDYNVGLQTALDIINDVWKQWDQFRAETGGEQLSFTDWLDLPLEDTEGYARNNLQRRDQ